ncbi:uncharacterized protein B0T15DRAFT_494777 [Chaetomium strumarium]|uniref:Uncharacterized protein n=1 Tax=Chaetomium strumarium TaxID=1170767 RepID=A0AAJ0M0C1_9PEZI|nr:hypothetical protein B0T15DRAFT_494777 [Chaetomium strumarium]
MASQGPHPQDCLPAPAKASGAMTSPVGWNSPFELPLPDDPQYGLEAWVARKKEMACDGKPDNGPPPTWQQCAQQHLWMWQAKVEHGLLDYPSDESGLIPEAQTSLIGRWAEVLRGLKRAHNEWKKRWFQAYGYWALRLCTKSQLAALLGVPINRLPRHPNFGSMVAATLHIPLTKISEYRARDYDKQRWRWINRWEIFKNRRHPHKQQWRRQDKMRPLERPQYLRERQLLRHEEQHLRNPEGEYLDLEVVRQLGLQEAKQQQEIETIIDQLKSLEELDEWDRREASQTK